MYLGGMYIEGINEMYFILFCPLCYCVIVFQTKWPRGPARYSRNGTHLQRQTCPGNVCAGQRLIFSPPYPGET